MKKELVQLHSAISSIESRVERAEEKGGECITLTLEEAYDLMDKLSDALDDINEEE